MTLNDSVQGLRLHVMHRALELGSVSRTCREAGISRSLFYRWRKRYLAYGPDGLHPRHTHARRGRPSAVSVAIERTVLAMALAWPTWGPARLSAQLARPEYGGHRIAPSCRIGALRESTVIELAFEAVNGFPASNSSRCATQVREALDRHEGRVLRLAPSAQ